VEIDALEMLKVPKHLYHSRSKPLLPPEMTASLISSATQSQNLFDNSPVNSAGVNLPAKETISSLSAASSKQSGNLREVNKQDKILKNLKLDRTLLT
jgi:hypothetical protein